MDRVEIACEAGHWQPRDEAAVRAAATTALHLLRTHKHLTGPVELSVLLSDDETIQNLNKTHRGKDKPTNVLSFPLPAPPPHDENEARPLGDIALAYETVAREAEEQNKRFAAHLSHLTVHGLLHLLGFDHEKGKPEAMVMEALERDMMGALGFADPYADVCKEAVPQKTAASVLTTNVLTKGDVKASP